MLTFFVFFVFFRFFVGRQAGGQTSELSYYSLTLRRGYCRDNAVVCTSSFVTLHLQITDAGGRLVFLPPSVMSQESCVVYHCFPPDFVRVQRARRLFARPHYIVRLFDLDQSIE